MHTRKLNKSGAAPLDATAEETAAVDRLSAERDLRLHVVGDAYNRAAAVLLGNAATRYVRRAVLRGTRRRIAGQDIKDKVRVWTYTHAWRHIHRRWWGKHISVLASCETTYQVRHAQDRGYATSIVVDHHESPKSYIKDGLKLLPCPEQTLGIQCVNCRLCMREDILKEAGLTIAFAAHGSQQKKIKEAIRQ